MKPFIRFHPSYITISCSLVYRYFQKDNTLLVEKNNDLLKVRIFQDDEEKLIGFKPDEEGYKITICGSGRSYHISCKQLTDQIQGTFYPDWSEKYQMLIFKY
uniref:Uncharacterized protein n=1 Tax=viral metagenome TaxID=1070528 RepID=A0A6H2A2I7_9ZZZZ